MIGNSDIFDEEELRAIANDDSSGQSSSCSSVGNAADQTENNDMICAPAPTQKVDSTRQLQLTNKHDEHQATTAVKGKESDESSSDDGGFLESWLEVEKRTTSTTPNISQDSVATNVKCSINNIEQNDTTTSKEEEGGNQHILQLGESALQWISLSAKKKKSEINNSNKCGIVGIEHNHHVMQEAFSRTSTLRLTKTSCRKRSHSGKETSEATIEEISANNDMMPSSERTVERGRIIDSSATGMVDCLARFDPRRKCYVLEVVDLLVGNLEPSLNVPVIHRNDDKIMFDPLTSKKKAEKQLKSLKKRK